MKITPSSSPKKPAYPALLAIAAVGAMVSPACAQNEAENPPVPEVAKVSQQAQKEGDIVKAPREPQKTIGKARVRPPQARAGAFKRKRYPNGDKDSAKPATLPEKK